MADGRRKITLTAEQAARRNKIRDDFAKAALAGLLSLNGPDRADENLDGGRYVIGSGDLTGDIDADRLSGDAYDIANAMIRAKEERCDDLAGEEVEEGSDGHIVGENDA